MSEIEKLLKQVEELHTSIFEIKEGKSLNDLGVIIESQILDIVLNNYKETLIKFMN